MRRRRLVRGSHRVVFGPREAVEQGLAACGWQLNTSFVERLHLSIRQHVAAVGRRVSTLCKGEDGLCQQLVLSQCSYNFCLPHASLRQALPQPISTQGAGSAKRWRPCPPAMAAGLTDRVGSLREGCCSVYPHGPSPRESEPAVRVGNSNWRGPEVATWASIMASATPFCFCTTQKHLEVKSSIISII